MAAQITGRVTAQGYVGVAAQGAAQVHVGVVAQAIYRVVGGGAGRGVVAQVAGQGLCTGMSGPSLVLWSFEAAVVASISNKAFD